MDRKSKLRMPGTGGGADTPDDILVSGALRVDLADQKVTIDGDAVTLAPKVYELLVILLSQPLRVHTRDALFERLWPQSVLLDANLTTTVSQLRKSLSEPLRECLRTVPRVGYSWDAEVGRLSRDGRPTVDGDDPEHADPQEIAARASLQTPRFRFRALPLVAAALALLLTIAIVVWVAVDTTRERPIVLMESVDFVDRAETRDWMPLMVEDAMRQQLQLSPRLRLLDPEDSAGLIAAGNALGTEEGADFRLEVVLAAGDMRRGTVELRASLTAEDGETRRWRRTIGDQGPIIAAHALARDIQKVLVDEAPALQWQSITPAATAAYEEGLRAETRGRPMEARRAYERAISLSPGLASARTRLARILADQGHDDLAAAQWQVAAASDSLGPEARSVAQAQALLLNGRPAEAAMVYDGLAQRFADEPAHRWARIDALLRAGGASLPAAERALAAEKRRDSPLDVARFALLEARLRRAQARLEDASVAYQRAAEASARARQPMLLGDARSNLGQIHRARGEHDAAAAAFDAAATAFRDAGSESLARAAELNRLLLPVSSSDPAALGQRAETLEAHARRASAIGNGQIAGQALDAAAVDWLALGELERGRELADEAEVLLRSAAPALRIGPRITLALIDLQEGLPRSALDKLEGLRPVRGSAQDVDLRLLRVRAWRELGQPIRAQDELEAAFRQWNGVELGPTALKKAACAELAIALQRLQVKAAKAVLPRCGTAEEAAIASARAEIAAIEGDRAAVFAAVRDWQAGIARAPQAQGRFGASMALARFLAENGDLAGARLYHSSLDREIVAGLTPPMVARYWLNAAVFAALAGENAAFRDAMARADHAIGPEHAGLRRDYRLLELAAGGPRNREALVAFAREAETAGAVGMKARADRLAGYWLRSSDPWRDSAWWRYGDLLR